MGLIKEKSRNIHIPTFILAFQVKPNRALRSVFLCPWHRPHSVQWGCMLDLVCVRLNLF